MWSGFHMKHILFHLFLPQILLCSQSLGYGQPRLFNLRWFCYSILCVMIWMGLFIRLLDYFLGVWEGSCQGPLPKLTHTPKNPPCFHSSKGRQKNQKGLGNWSTLLISTLDYKTSWEERAQTVHAVKAECRWFYIAPISLGGTPGVTTLLSIGDMGTLMSLF